MAAEPPEELCCPITRELMRDPVCTTVGNSFERAALLQAWARQPRDERDPLTNERVSSTALVPNQTLRRQIVAWLDAHPEFTPDGWDSRQLLPLEQQQQQQRQRRRNVPDRSRAVEQVHPPEEADLVYRLEAVERALEAQRFVPLSSDSEDASDDGGGESDGEEGPGHLLVSRRDTWDALAPLVACLGGASRRESLIARLNLANSTARYPGQAPASASEQAAALTALLSLLTEVSSHGGACSVLMRAHSSGHVSTAQLLVSVSAVAEALDNCHGLSWQHILARLAAASDASAGAAACEQFERKAEQHWEAVAELHARTECLSASAPSDVEQLWTIILNALRPRGRASANEGVSQFGLQEASLFGPPQALNAAASAAMVTDFMQRHASSLDPSVLIGARGFQLAQQLLAGTGNRLDSSLLDVLFASGSNNSWKQPVTRALAGSAPQLLWALFQASRGMLGYESRRGVSLVHLAAAASEVPGTPPMPSIERIRLAHTTNRSLAWPAAADGVPEPDDWSSAGAWSGARAHDILPSMRALFARFPNPFVPPGFIRFKNLELDGGFTSYTMGSVEPPAGASPPAMPAAESDRIAAVLNFLDMLAQERWFVTEVAHTHHAMPDIRDVALHLICFAHWHASLWQNETALQRISKLWKDCLGVDGPVVPCRGFRENIISGHCAICSMPTWHCSSLAALRFALAQHAGIASDDVTHEHAVDAARVITFGEAYDLPVEVGTALLQLIDCGALQAEGTGWSGWHFTEPLPPQLTFSAGKLVVVDDSNTAAAAALEDNAPLHRAATGGNISAVLALLESHVDPNTGDENGARPLHLACAEGHLDIARLLLDRGAAADIYDNIGMTPLHFAAAAGHGELLQLLLDRGACVNAANADGFSALHFTADGGYSACVQFLLSRGANVEARDAHGRVALHYSALGSHVEATRELLFRGADRNVRDEKGDTPAELAGFGTVKFMLTRM